MVMWNNNIFFLMWKILFYFIKFDKLTSNIFKNNIEKGKEFKKIKFNYSRFNCKNY